MASATSASYQWLDCDSSFAPISGEIGQSYIATSSGNYAVEVSQNNCKDTSACESVILVDIVENSFKHLPKIYPNPTSGKLNIELYDINKKLNIKVRTLDGKIILNNEYNSIRKLDFEINEAPGIYIVEVTNQQGNSAKLRVIKY